MQKRFVSLWFRHLLTDWLTQQRPELEGIPVGLTVMERNRIILTAINNVAQNEGISVGMTAADAKAIIPDLKVLDAVPGQAEKILQAAGKWCIRYSPAVAVDLPDGLLMEVTGCTHLWGGEHTYLQNLLTALRQKGYRVRGALAGTTGTAWAIARYGKQASVITSGDHIKALYPLPPAALRLEPVTLERLHKLGFHTVQKLLSLPKPALWRRFGEHLLLRIDQATGLKDEPLQILHPPEPYQVRLPFLEPIRTRLAIEKAILQLLADLCQRLQKEGKGLRGAILKGYRVDGKSIQISIGTNKPTAKVANIFKLLELKISTIEPALGIELFILEAPKVEDCSPEQERLWKPDSCGLEDTGVAELLDRLTNKFGSNAINRYLPQERYWPEHAIRPAQSLDEKPATIWQTGKPRPMLLLPKPERIEVMALLPDNPPMLFIYKGERHVIKKADDAERIEREWWLEPGLHRDYYTVEDEQGRRYWLFRSGHYGQEETQWYIHGFFA
ncbi:Y-family DNA polymerase [Mucilaginibacter lacusdianchii]|uniref:Y-family DNA polymerase n=1 Tax=Mucilaginibacter lacusdianchii TaxID=2684211 RepID=UPI00131EAF4A|nr:DNA polymerase Y family protein [Mucilaginibacter sp. JXJ CY 39]